MWRPTPSWQRRQPLSPHPINNNWRLIINTVMQTCLFYLVISVKAIRACNRKNCVQSNAMMSLILATQREYVVSLSLESSPI